MKKFIKNNIKIFMTILITTIVVGSASVYAASQYFAKDMNFMPANENFKKENGEPIENVEDALNELYKNKSNSYIILDSNRSSFNIPNNVKTAYLIVERGTSNIPFTINISGTNLIDYENVSNQYYADRGMAIYTDVFKLNLSGESGNIDIQMTGGEANSYAWSSIIIY